MDNKDKKELQRLIQENKTVDQTESIRQRNDSSAIREDILKLYKIKYQLGISNEKELRETIKNQCEFLFKKYRELYEILITKDMNLSFLMKLIELLENIENGKMTQHESSFVLGKLLKEIYIDPKINNRDDISDGNSSDNNNEPMNISWSEFKRINK